MKFEPEIHPLHWFRDRYREGALEIKPPFQRKPVWARRQKCYLIESILLNMPIPEIFIQRVVSAAGDSTAYAVVDGQQRIRTILQFIGTETDEAEVGENDFALDKLAATSTWLNVTFRELPDDVRRNFFGYKFSVRFLDTERDEDVQDMFKRLNKYLTPLNNQELRHATYFGPFVRFAQGLADDDYWAENRIVSPAYIRRMNDVEFMSDLAIGVMHGPTGGSPKIIDSYYEAYEDFETEFPEQTKTGRLFHSSLHLIQECFLTLPRFPGLLASGHHAAPTAAVYSRS